MRTILHIIFQKPAIKLCLIVLLMFVFINESFSQAYSPEPYSGSYSSLVYEAPGLFGFNRYSISVGVNYSGGGHYDPTPSITDHLYVSSFLFNNTYSYSIISKNVDINGDKMVIYYDPETSCPNHNMPCNIRGHSRLIPDWATLVTFWTYYDLQITRKTYFLGRFLNKAYTVDGVGSSTSRKFYRGRMFGTYFTYIGN